MILNEVQCYLIHSLPTLKLRFLHTNDGKGYNEYVGISIVKKTGSLLKCTPGRREGITSIRSGNKAFISADTMIASNINVVYDTAIPWIEIIIFTAKSFAFRNR